MRTIAQIADLTRLKHYGDLMDTAMLMARAVNDEAQWLIKHREFHDTINRVIAEGIRANRRQRGKT